LRYDVITYGDSALRRKAVPVERIDDDVRQLVRDMLQTMYAREGVGLAAEQIGRTEAVFVVDVPAEVQERDAKGPAVPMPLAMINPRIVRMEGEQTAQEGCLSFPDVFVDVKRAAEVWVTFTNLHDREETLRACGLLARAIQHEIDHLDGVLLVDRMTSLQKVANAGRLKRMRKEAAA
jgi:peptide deformylase